ncbi:MAG: beta-N-acetylhexosaminidase, partial [Saprospiraceae bacterium]|nr:beta-N-acetylhexosaminidase [Saprospiraceae bacterium]
MKDTNMFVGLRWSSLWIALSVATLTGACHKRVLTTDEVALIPVPQDVNLLSGVFEMGPKVALLVAEEDWIPSTQVFRESLLKTMEWDISLVTEGSAGIRVMREEQLTGDAYTLSVSSEGIDIGANAASGVFYALQTLGQLLPIDRLQHGKGKPDLLGVPAITIRDQPRFKWRGFMLDVSRHFFDVEDVKFYLDQMASLKFNVFHWHLTDDQGWRIESKVYPKLHEVGAWRVDYTDYDWSHNRWWGRPKQQPGDSTTYGGYYTQEDIREIIAYAGDRHIEVLPEIDVPGHSQALIASYAHLACQPGPYTVATGGAYKDNTLCPSKESTYQFMEQILKEVADLFPFKYIHIGGDECNKSAWKTHSGCQEAIRSLGLRDESELQSYFIQRMEDILSANGKKMIGWD